MLSDGQKEETKVIVPTAINSVQPIIIEDEHIKEIVHDSPYRDVKYPDTALKLPFTGAVLIGDNLLRNQWGDFQHPWHYETVSELQFENGAFIRDVDLSALALHIREEDKALMRLEAERQIDSHYAPELVKKYGEHYGSWLDALYHLTTKDEWHSCLNG